VTDFGDVLLSCAPAIVQTIGALIVMLAFVGAARLACWLYERRNPLRLDACDCERCITGRHGLPCACDTWCGETTCLADAVPYADLVTSARAEAMIAELMAELDKGELR
jgi:hypothetical protein